LERNETLVKLLNKLLKIKLIRFALVGGSGTILNLGMLFILTDLVKLAPAVSYVVVFVIVVSSNYYLNSIWTFKGKLNYMSLIRYAIISLGTLLINEGILYLMTYRLGLWYMFSACIGILVAFMINYTLSRRLVWKKQYNPLPQQKKIAYWQ
jgi:dolichol-phosphate mannosyltransferase